MPTHDDEAVMNGAPDFEEGLRCEPPAWEGTYGTGEPVPLSKATRWNVRLKSNERWT